MRRVDTGNLKVASGPCGLANIPTEFIMVNEQKPTYMVTLADM